MVSEQISEQEYDAAVERGLEMRRTLPRPIAVRFDPALHRVEVDLNWGYSIHFGPERAQGLEKATDAELAEVEIAGVFGIYFPKIDVDLWVPGLAKGRFGNDAWEAAWAEVHRREQAA